MAGTEGEAALLKRKRQFFNELSDLDTDDEAEDPGRNASIMALRKRKANQDINSTYHHSLAGSPIMASKRLPRSVSDTDLTAKDRCNRSHTVPSSAPGVKQGNSDVFAGAIPRFQPTKPVRTTSAVPKATGKSKRNAIVQKVPEVQQIFKGLVIYFFPNNDAHPARKFRINKALEFGAIWQSDWNEDVTHVVVDKSIEFGLLLKYIKRERLPNSIIVVTEVWPAECIAYRALLDPGSEQFRVLGHLPSPTEKIASQPSALNPSSSGDSLELKAPAQGAHKKSDETQSIPQHTKQVIAEPPGSTDSTTSMTRLPADGGPTGIGSIKPAASNDLDNAIRQAQALQHIPLDEDETISRPGSSDGQVGDLSDTEGRSKPYKSKHLAFQDNYHCMQSHSVAEDGPNANTIAILQQMADYYDRMKDEWRPRAYRKAIASLRNHPTKVTTKQEALGLPFVGERLADKIEEIAFTSRLRLLDNSRAQPEDILLQTFAAVHGVGFGQASRWVREGYKSLDELLQKASLTESQRIGIEHYSDFNLRIPRTEVEAHGDLVRKALETIDPQFTLIVGGSYRRGATSSGDIDCLITRQGKSASYLRSVAFEKLIPDLFTTGFLKASLAVSTRADRSIWLGASCLPTSTIWRRIDLLLVPEEELGAALIYWTGSMRLLASHKGMRLNQHGLYRDVLRAKGRDILNEGDLIEGRDEKKIFEILGVPWRAPNERVC